LFRGLKDTSILGRTRARSAGVRRKLAMTNVKSTPNFLAFAISLPGGGLLMS